MPNDITNGEGAQVYSSVEIQPFRAEILGTFTPDENTISAPIEQPPLTREDLQAIREQVETQGFQTTPRYSVGSEDLFPLKPQRGQYYSDPISGISYVYTPAGWIHTGNYSVTQGQGYQSVGTLEPCTPDDYENPADDIYKLELKDEI